MELGSLYEFESWSKIEAFVLLCGNNKIQKTRENTQLARKFKKVQAKKLVKSNKLKKNFREIAFLTVLKIDFWLFLKLQKMEFG